MGVREGGEVGEAVADLLAGPVAAPADDVGRQPLLLERLLEQPERAGGAHEHDDLAGAPARVDLLAQPVGEQARLGAAAGGGVVTREPRIVLALPPRGVGEQQLDRRVARRRAELEEPQLAVRVGGRAAGAGDEGREALAEDRGERPVEDVEQLLGGAEVGPQGADAIGVERGPPLAEDLHVRAAEAVDRLELVADREQVVALDRLQHVELQPVRVLELVDHQQLEALAEAAADRVLAREQVADAELQVLEVEARARGLVLRVRPGERLQQLADEDHGRPRVVVGARLPVGAERLAVGLAGLLAERLGAAGQRRRLELVRRRDHGGGRGGGRGPLRPEHLRPRLERRERRRDALAVPGGGEVRGRRRARGRGRGGIGHRHLGRDRQRGPRRPTAAQHGVGAQDHPLQIGRIGGGEVDRGLPAAGRPRFQRGVVGLARQPRRGGLVEHLEVRVQAGRQRMGAQHAGAEAVDGPDPGAVDRARVLGLAELGEAPPQALAQLPRRLLGEGQGQHGPHRDAVDPHGLREALDHHGGLARAGVGGEQGGAAAVGDRGALLGGEGPAAHSSPFSSAVPSPARQIAG